MKSSKKPTIAELAMTYGVSEKTLKRYRAEGIDIHNATAVLEHAQTKKNGPRGPDSPRMKELREQKLELEIEGLKHALGVKKKQYVSREVIIRDTVSWMEKLRSVICGIRGVAPTWAGMDAPELYAQAGAFEHQFLTMVHSWGTEMGVIEKFPPATEEEAIAMGHKLAAIEVPPSPYNRPKYRCTCGRDV